MALAEMLESNSRGRTGTDKDLYSTQAQGSLKCLHWGRIYAPTCDIGMGINAGVAQRQSSRLVSDRLGVRFPSPAPIAKL